MKMQEMKIPDIYRQFRQIIEEDIIVFGDIQIELFRESDLDLEQENSPLPAGVGLKNHEPFDPDKHLIIAAGFFNEPWFIDITEPDPIVKAALPSGNEQGELRISCISNSLNDLATSLEYIQEAEKEMLHKADKDMLHIIFDRIAEINKNADTEFWEILLTKGEYWIVHGEPG